MRFQIRAQRVVKILALAGMALGSLTVAPRPCGAEQPMPQTTKAFESYIRSKEALNDGQTGDEKAFLRIDALPESNRRQAYADLRRGQIIVQQDEMPCAAEHCTEVPGGLIHDWVGLVFIPGTSLPHALTALQDYDRDATYYRPEVVQSKLLAKSGDEFRVFLRLKRAEVITVVFDTEYDIRYASRDATHAWSRAYSTRIVEVDDAGKPTEHTRPVGDDRGFLWRLYSYWRFYEADGGVYIQCNAVSLTRSVPAGLGWAIGSFLEKIPAESLRFTLDATRTALKNR